MQVVSPKKWIPLVALGTLVAAGLSWSVVGRIPITVSGQGVLVFPSKVVGLQFPAIEGKLKEINVSVGDLVQKGQVLATIDQSDLQKELQQQRDKLAQLQMQDRNADLLQLQRQDLDKGAIAQQRQTWQPSLAAVQALTPVLREKGLVAIQRDRPHLKQRLQTSRELLPTFKKIWENRQQLLKEGAVADDTVLQTKQQYLDSIAQIDEAESQLKQLDVKEADAGSAVKERLKKLKNHQARPSLCRRVAL